MDFSSEKHSQNLSQMTTHDSHMALDSLTLQAPQASATLTTNYQKGNHIGGMPNYPKMATKMPKCQISKYGGFGHLKPPKT